MRKLLPILLALIGTGAGVGAGFLLKPEPAEPSTAEVECVPPAEDQAIAPVEEPAAAPETREYVKLNNQFVVPIMAPDRVQSLVVASISLEVGIGATQTVYAREPKLRDVFLQVMFDHANIGGFDGAFTEAERMEPLRKALLQQARSVLGADVTDVLITEIARQDS